MTKKEKYIDLLKQSGRIGIENLIKYLEDTDFFIAPASTKFHNSFEGGLLEHSLNVYENLVKENKLLKKKYDNPSLIIVALLHDICKANFYEVTTRNVKKNDKWVKEPYYIVNDQMPLGHGEKSVIIAKSFIALTLEEALAIRWHMGAFEPSENYNTISTAYNQSKLALLLHIADLKATYIDEVK